MSNEARPVEATYSVVVPVYGNESMIDALVTRLEEMQANLQGTFEAVFVVDGSPDRSLEKLQAALPNSTLRAQVVAHSRNFGAFAAIKTGLAHANGRYIAAMAADLQEPADLIEGMLTHLASGSWDVAVGARVSREDPLPSRMFSGIYWRSYRRLIQRELPAGGVDVFAITREVSREIVALNESHSSLIGLLYWLGYRRIEIPYSRVQRESGKSGWSFRKRWNYLLDSVFSFTSLPITWILIIGTLGALASLVGAIWVFVTWLGNGIAVEGYTALMLVLLFSTGSILFAIGIIGTYIWRTYENTKQRPGAVVRSVEQYSTGEH